MMVTMRGEWAEFNPWQVPMGSIVEPTLKLCDVHVYRADRAEEVAEAAAAAIDLAFNGDLAVAPGTKVGGYPGWTQSPDWPVCGCSSQMQHLLTVASWVVNV